MKFKIFFIKYSLKNYTVNKLGEKIFNENKYREKNA